MSDRVLLVDDDRAVREALGQTLELAGLRPVLAGSFIEAKDHIGRDFAGIVVSDIRMPGRDGFHLLEHARKTDPELPVILLTGHGDVPMAVRGMSAGAFDFLEKPCNPSDFVAVVQKALKTRALVLENRALRREIRRGDAAARMLVGTSALSEQMREAARAAARSSAEVLISGPPGSGTAKMAEVIHLLSAAATRPLLKLSAATADAPMLADTFSRAEGGTIFLDEIAAMAAGAQFALIDLIDSNPGIRVIAGTYRDLEGEVQQGRFNPDLFYKLDVIRVRIPALKERPEDIPVLFRHYVAIACEQSDLPMPEITPEVIAELMAQDWPGNARSLMNAAMRFAMGLDAIGPERSRLQGAAPLGLVEQMARVERSLLIEALQRHGGNATEAAATLKLPRKTFYDKLARHGIRPETYRR
ncbi:two-component system C4-dicarboxylate transport response regulator DctD [Albidovulum inexpectatum]|uniref:Two-component system C4-dicarboxylate transport response regulator DctD n=1 Tax=Albidovulum inexpectatum TaxID=196587 RepID=A0A2S5JIL5_9RHOB|nr:sigma-54 dependent transcriptional regulator [Albidovulum inexpectatum]PPB81198.1 two-component system C4-dicarboxylate transport response regulator DctD [Albidovulum inexpectatum]